MRDGATRREKVKRMCVCVSLFCKTPCLSLPLSLNCLFFSLFFSRFPFRFARSPAAETHKQTLPVCVVCVFPLRSNREEETEILLSDSRFSQWSGNDSYPDVIVTWMVNEGEGRERSIEEDTRRRRRKERVYRHIQQQSGLSPLPYQ